MTKVEAVQFLSQAAWKYHKAVYDTIGPSHGDPGGQRMFSVSKSCKALVYSPVSGNVTTGDEKLCSCGAVAHNRKVQESLVVLGTNK